MDEIETRIAALEALFIKTGKWLEPGAIDEITRSIEADANGGGASQVNAEVARHALSILSAAQARVRPALPIERKT